MELKKDKTGNSYIETSNSRITLVVNRPASGRDWSGGNTVRVQAKRGDGSLHMGAELPVEDLPEVLAGIMVLVQKS